MEKSFADLEYERKKRKTGRERFPERMDVLIPWDDPPVEDIRPWYPSAGKGRVPYPLESCFPEPKLLLEHIEGMLHLGSDMSLSLLHPLCTASSPLSDQRRRFPTPMATGQSISRPAISSRFSRPWSPASP